MPESRIPTAVDALSSATRRRGGTSPGVLATYLGLDAGQDSYDDFSPTGRAGFTDLARRMLTEARALTPHDEVDRITLALLDERLGLELETREMGADLLSVNGIASDPY